MRFLVLVLLAAVVGCGGDDGVSPRDARGKLDNRGIEFTAEAFQDSAFAGNLAVVRLFVQAGMSVNATNKWDWTVLHAAAGGGHLEVVEILVGAGAAVDARDEYGRDGVARGGV